MNEDLVTLRVLAVSKDLAFRNLCQVAARTASIPLEFFDVGPCQAKEQLQNGPLDIVIIDEVPAPLDRESMIVAARQCNPPPFIVVTDAGASVANSTAVTVVKKPVDGPQACALMEQCVRARIPTRVLVVDDSSTMRSIVRKVLASSRYAFDVVDAAEGAVALEQLRSKAIDVVILDYNMPGLNGLETLAQIKQQAPHIGVVMMTTTVDPALVGKAKLAGAAGFLKKPFFPTDIEAVLDRHFAQRIVAQ